MIYNTGWDKSRERFKAFWQGKIIDRCLIAVKAPIGKTEVPKTGDTFLRRTDPETIIKNKRAEFSETYFAGEAFPQIFIDLGAGGHAGFFKGARYKLEENTVWFFPSCEEPDELVFDPESFLYKKTLSLASDLARDSRGDYIVSMPDCTGNADALAHLLGTETLLEMMLDEPDKVKRALARIEEAYESAMKGVYERVGRVNGGGSSVGWLNTWAPGFHAQMQCDMSVMISNDMFEDFIMPELRRQCEFLDYPLYHFDGVEQIRHLKSILSIPELKAIQWTQVSGQPPATEYIKYLKQIQDAGKNLVIIVGKEQIEPLLNSLSPEGLLLVTEASDPKEADEIVSFTEKRTVR